MTDIITMSALLIIIAGLVVVSLILRIKLQRANESISLQEANALMLLDELAKGKEREAQAALEKTDGFVKFLSDSREWAFNYIEDVQTSIQGLIKAMSVNDKEKILEHYNELQRFLPEEENNKENKK